MAAPADRLQGVPLAYGGRRIGTDLTLDVAPGAFVAILGPNGAGKTSLLRAILGLVEPEAGRIEAMGAPPKRGDPGIGYVPHHHHFGPETPLRGPALARPGPPWHP